MKKVFNVFMMIMLLMSNFLISISTVAQTTNQRFNGEDIVNFVIVSPKDIQHTGQFKIQVGFTGQSEDPDAPYYIYPGKEIFIPIESDGIATASLAAKLPELENARINVDSSGIRITFLDGIENQHDIRGSLYVTMRGENSEEDSIHTLTIAEQEVSISNRRGGSTGVFAGKTGMHYGESNPDYVTWFLRGNINGDQYPGGPLQIKDKVGEGQKLDGNGINISLFWGGQQHQTYVKSYNSIEEFLSSEYGTSVGSKIDYNKENGTINVFIPEGVLNGKEFSFTYDSLITDFDLKEFKNKADFDFFENNKPDHIETDAVVLNALSGDDISGKRRANLNINKVVKGTNIPIEGVTFEISRADKGPLFVGKEDTVVRYTTDENGEIKESGFIPGELVAVEIAAPEKVKFNPNEEIKFNLKANNKNESLIIENEIATVSIPVEKRWVGKAGESAEIHLKADGKTIASQTLTAKTNWQHTFKELPKHDATTGELIDYMITETPVKGYNTTISGTANEGFVVTNTIVGKVSVGVTKEWVGPKAKSVTIQLLANDKQVSEATLTAETNWQHTFDKLDQYDKDGKEISYRVTETQLEGYTTEIIGDVSTGFRVINTKTSKPVQKTSTNSLNKPNNSISNKPINKRNNSSALPQTGEKETTILVLLGIILLLGLLLPMYKKMNQ